MSKLLITIRALLVVLYSTLSIFSLIVLYSDGWSYGDAFAFIVFVYTSYQLYALPTKEIADDRKREGIEYE